MKRLLLALGLLLAVGSPPGLRAQIATDPGDGLQPGDVVEIQIWQREELSGEFTVAPDGSLLHPLYRQVTVTGIPTAQVEDRLRSFLRRFEADPQLVVQPLYRVSVSGAVMRPDIYDLPPGTTVAQAVIRAGGVAEQGKADKVRLVRGASTTEVDLTDPGSTMAHRPVRSGDQILVESRREGGFRSVVLPLIQIATSIANVVSVVTR